MPGQITEKAPIKSIYQWYYEQFANTNQGFDLNNLWLVTIYPQDGNLDAFKAVVKSEAARFDVGSTATDVVGRVTGYEGTNLAKMVDAAWSANVIQLPKGYNINDWAAGNVLVSVKSVMIPTDQIKTKTAEMGAGYTWVPPIFADKHEAFQPFTLTLYYTTYPFSEFIVRPWAMGINRYGLKLRALRCNIVCTLFTKNNHLINNNNDWFPKFEYRFYGCYPLGVPNLDFTYDNDAQDKSVAIQFGYDFYRITIPDPKYSEINRFKGVNQDTFISVMKQSVEKVPNTEDFYDSPGYNSDDNKKTNDGSRSYTARANILSRPGANGTLKGTVGQDSFGDVAWYTIDGLGGDDPGPKSLKSDPKPSPYDNTMKNGLDDVGNRQSEKLIENQGNSAGITAKKSPHESNIIGDVDTPNGITWTEIKPPYLDWPLFILSLDFPPDRDDDPFDIMSIDMKPNENDDPTKVGVGRTPNIDGDDPNRVAFDATGAIANDEAENVAENGVIVDVFDEPDSVTEILSLPDEDDTPEDISLEPVEVDGNDEPDRNLDATQMGIGEDEPRRDLPSQIMSVDYDEPDRNLKASAVNPQYDEPDAHLPSVDSAPIEEDEPIRIRDMKGSVKDDDPDKIRFRNRGVRPNDDPEKVKSRSIEVGEKDDPDKIKKMREIAPRDNDDPDDIDSKNVELSNPDDVDDVAFPEPKDIKNDEPDGYIPDFAGEIRNDEPELDSEDVDLVPVNDEPVDIRFDERLPRKEPENISVPEAVVSDDEPIISIVEPVSVGGDEPNAPKIDERSVSDDEPNTPKITEVGIPDGEAKP